MLHLHDFLEFLFPPQKVMLDSTDCAGLGEVLAMEAGSKNGNATQAGSRLSGPPPS